MSTPQNWTKALYKELAEKITNSIAAIEWVDLWHNQVGFLEDEHPFPTPAVFLSFRSNNLKDLSQKVQQVILQVDVYLYFETFTDTYKGSYNQDAALSFLDTIDELNKILHASSGENYSGMKRVSFNPEDTGNAGNLYRISYECLSNDYTAFVEYENGTFADMEVERFIVEP